MLKPIAAALEALALAKEFGGELDLDYYAKTHQALADVIVAVQNHDRILTNAEASPTGADYEHVMKTLGLRADATTDTPSIAGLAVLAHYTPDAKALETFARLLGLAEDATLSAVQITAEVVDVTEGVIGFEDVSIVPAVLDLTTGKLVLVDKELGHPLLEWEDVGVTIHHNGQRYNLPILEHSIPDGLWRTEITEHINKFGYWAVLDLRALVKSVAETRRA